MCKEEPRYRVKTVKVPDRLTPPKGGGAQRPQDEEASRPTASTAYSPAPILVANRDAAPHRDSCAREGQVEPASSLVSRYPWAGGGCGFHAAAAAESEIRRCTLANEHL